jgi:hypothetical protein
LQGANFQIERIRYFCGMNGYQLFMVLLGCTPANRNTEQHDVFFGIAHNLEELLPSINEFWPEAEGKFHIDGWRTVTRINECAVTVKEKPFEKNEAAQLFFINLGGYKPGEFEEFHYKMMVAAPDKGSAVQQAKQTAFYQHTGYSGAASHIDDKYGVDVDDIFEIADILPAAVKQKFQLVLQPAEAHHPEDPIHLGYLTPDKIRKGMASE